MNVNIVEIIGGIARFLPHVFQFQITFIQQVIPIYGIMFSDLEYLKHILKLGEECQATLLNTHTFNQLGFTSCYEELPQLNQVKLNLSSRKFWNYS